jgi:hypothetical protein
MNTGLKSPIIYSLWQDNNNYFAGTGGGIGFTNNNGFQWYPSDSGLTTRVVFSVTEKGTTLFAGVSGQGVYRSTNYGAYWIKVDSGLTSMYPQSFT